MYKNKSWKKTVGLSLILSLAMALSLNAAPLKIMPLGDSITEGDSQVPDTPENNTSTYPEGSTPANADRISYRGKLWDLLKTDGYTFNETSGDLDFVGTQSTGSNHHAEFDQDHEGFGGKTSKDIRDGIAGWLDSKPADIVLLHIGTNDPGKNIPIGSYDDADQEADTSVNNVKKILDTIFDKNVDAKVFVAKIIKNNRAEGFGSGWLTTNFNNKIAEMVNHHSKATQIKMVDMENGAGFIYDPCGIDNGDMQPYHSEDNTFDYHPNPNGYAKMGQKWHDALVASAWLPSLENDTDHLWTLNGNSSPFADTAGDDATCSGDACPTQTAGQVDNAQQFSGAQTLIASASGYAANDSYSIEFWMNADDTTGLEVAFREGGIWVGRDGNTLKYELPGGPGNHEAGTLNSGWNHVVIVKDASAEEAKAYINGQLTDTSTSTATAVNATELYIGDYNPQSTQYEFKGALDEVALYNKALSASDVEGHYNAQQGADETAPVLSEVTPVITPTNDATPNYTFSATEGGSIAIGGSCGTATPTSAVTGNNTITFATLANGTYSNCTVTVTDAAGNTSEALSIASFEINTALATPKIHLWTLNGNSSPFADTAGDDATCSGDACPTQTAGQVDNAQQFSGAQTLTASASGYAANDSYSIEFWMNADDTTGLEVAFRESGIWVGRDGNTFKYELPGGPSNHEAGTLNSGWNHVVIVKDASAEEAKAYINGQLTDTSASTATAVNATELYIGDYNPQSTQFEFKGALDEVALYGDALPASEIEDHYNAQNGGGGDTVNPVITLTDGDMTLTVGDTYTDPGYAASDDTDGNITANVVVAGDTVDTATAGTYVVTYNVDDAAGNHATQVTRTVTVNAAAGGDTVKPVITMTGADVTLTVGETYNDAGATATDDVDGDITGNIVIVNPVNTSAEGNYTVTYNVDDAAGNHAVEVTRAVEVKAAAQVDETVPVITLTGAAAVTLTVGDAYTDAGATANDNKDGDITGNIVIVNPVNTSAEGNYTVTYNVDDAAGNHAVEVTRAVEVKAAVDTTAPVITLTGSNPITIIVDNTYTEFGATAEDNKDGNISSNIVIDATAVNTSAAGNYTVTYNVDDAAGNHAAEVTRTVEVVVAGTADTTKPTIILVGDATVTLTVGDAYTDAGATASDNVDGDITANIVTTGTVDTATAGTYTVTYDVNDTAGNQATQVTRTVTVNVVEIDTDGDGIPDVTDTDDDNDGVLDENDAFPLDASESVDTDGDGIGDNADPDDDNNGIADVDEQEWFNYADGKVTAETFELSAEGVTHEVQANADSITLFHKLNGGNGCQAYVRANKDGEVETGYESCANGDDATLQGAANAGTHAKIIKENGKIVIETTLDLNKDKSFIIGGK